MRTVQGQRRAKLLNYWESKCCATGLAIPELPRANHIEPWKDSTAEGRVDVYNGLLLSGSLDLTYDQGFISFRDAGKMLVSSQLSGTALAARPLGCDERIPRRLEHKKYLAIHRENVHRG